MLRQRFHLALAWLCLIWFGLSHTLFASGMVICHDGAGVSRLEWSCERNTGGECVGSTDTSAADDPDRPCEDTPVKGDAESVKAPARSLDKTVVAIVSAVLAVSDWAPRHQAAAWPTTAAERPPDALKHIRSVVLLV